MLHVSVGLSLVRAKDVEGRNTKESLQMNNLLGPGHQECLKTANAELEHRIHHEHTDTHSYWLTMGKTETVDRGKVHCYFTTH